MRVTPLRHACLRSKYAPPGVRAERHVCVRGGCVRPSCRSRETHALAGAHAHDLRVAVCVDGGLYRELGQAGSSAICAEIWRAAMRTLLAGPTTQERPVPVSPGGHGSGTLVPEMVAARTRLRMRGAWGVGPADAEMAAVWGARIISSVTLRRHMSPTYIPFNNPIKNS
jgi:hypothetical protein